MNYCQLMQTASELGAKSGERGASCALIELHLDANCDPLEGAPIRFEDDSMPEWARSRPEQKYPGRKFSVQIGFFGGKSHDRMHVCSIVTYGECLRSEAAFKLGVVISSLVDAASAWHDAACGIDRSAIEPQAV